MKTILITVGVIIAALLAIIVTIALVVMAVVHKHMGSLSAVVKSVKEASDEVENTPKSLMGVEGVVLPKIKADFPEFDPRLMKSYVKSFALDYFAAMTAGKATASSFQKNCSRQFCEMIIAQAPTAGKFADAKVHKVVISDYRTSEYDATVVFQLAVEYRYNGKSNRSQEKYEVDYSYFLEDYSGHQEISSMKCPNCGAPIESLDRGNCPYCDYKLDVHEEAIVLDRTWKITDIKKC